MGESRDSKIIERGQRFRDVDTRAFGQAADEWIVDDLRAGSDGVEYAHLVRAFDLTQRKTLSVAILGDRRRFRRV